MFGFLIVLMATLLVLVTVTPNMHQNREMARINETRLLVSKLGLTDLALMTESRYTRHPSQADIHTAFQDHPAALDHFPSGSLISPPQHLTTPLITAETSHVVGKTTSPN